MKEPLETTVCYSGIASTAVQNLDNKHSKINQWKPWLYVICEISIHILTFPRIMRSLDICK